MGHQVFPLIILKSCNGCETSMGSHAPKWCFEILYAVVTLHRKSSISGGKMKARNSNSVRNKDLHLGYIRLVMIAS